MIKRLFKIPFVKIHKIENYESVVRIYASIRSTRSRCPLCGKYSNRVHDYYIRTISDIPIFQSKTIILLKTSKFKYVNKQCQRKVFSEQTPAILRYSGRTERTEKLLERAQQTDKTEFWRIFDLNDNSLDLYKMAIEWQYFYNYKRPHASLNGKIPWQKFIEVQSSLPIQPEVTNGFWNSDEQILPRNNEYLKFVKPKAKTKNLR